ncbi:MAG: alpha/beta hydrolase [Sphingobacterium sp.]|nr:alpha/beta hydrolase [Sphingobacterium sp.]
MSTLITANSELCYEVFGKSNKQDMILISGLGSQMIRWDLAFCEMLVERGFRVIRFDNRDSGASLYTGESNIDLDRPIHAIFNEIRPEDIPYSLVDMAHDVIALLDHMKIEKAHIVGRSMGGMIAQLLASDFPKRIASMTIIMSTSRKPGLPLGDSDVMDAMLKPAVDKEKNRELYIKDRIGFAKRIYGQFPLNEVYERWLIETEIGRSRKKNTVVRQLLAIVSTPYDDSALKRIKVPVLVIHGAEDPIFKPACGQDIAQQIPGATFCLVREMGHAIAPELFGVIVKSIMEKAITN